MGVKGSDKLNSRDLLGGCLRVGLFGKLCCLETFGQILREKFFRILFGNVLKINLLLINYLLDIWNVLILLKIEGDHYVLHKLIKQYGKYKFLNKPPKVLDFKQLLSLKQIMPFP